MCAAVTVIVAAVALRNLVPQCDRVDRDLWSALCRIVLVLWAISIVWRANGRQCVDIGAQPHSLLSTRFDGSLCGVQDVAYYGTAQIAFYVSEAVWILRECRQRRKDDGLLLLHHAVTVGLLAFWGIYHNLYWLSVLLPSLHDFSDIFVDGAKYARRAAQKSACGFRLRNALKTLSDVLFAGFVLSWFAIRVYYIPWRFLPALLVAPDRDTLPHALVAFGILCALQVAQAYWTLLIVRAVYTALQKGGNVEDEREK